MVAAVRSASLTVSSILFLTIAGGFAGGCRSKLETGYDPRRLGASSAERRAFYAPPFTAEARAAQQERRDDMRQRRPVYGG